MIGIAIAYALVDVCLNLIEREIKLNVDVQSHLDDFNKDISKLKSMGFSDIIIKSIIDTHGMDALTALTMPYSSQMLYPQQTGKSYIGYDLFIKADEIKKKHR